MTRRGQGTDEGAMGPTHAISRLPRWMSQVAFEEIHVGVNEE